MKVSTSIKLDTNIWKMARKRAIDLDIPVSKYIEDMIIAELLQWKENVAKQIKTELEEKNDI